MNLDPEQVKRKTDDQFHELRHRFGQTSMSLQLFVVLRHRRRDGSGARQSATHLQAPPNLLMWIAGRRHVNVVDGFPSADPNRHGQGFWQVETCSLRDFPLQFRTFEISLDADYTVSIEAVNVDVAMTAGTPAAQSRKYAIAT